MIARPLSQNNGKRPRVTEFNPAKANRHEKPKTGFDVANKDAEDAVIGCVLQEPKLFPMLAEYLQPSDFCLLRNGMIWYAFEQLSAKGEHLDVLNVAGFLDKEKSFIVPHNAPDRHEYILAHLHGLSSAAPMLENAVTYAKMVREAALRIRLLQYSDEVRALAFDKSLSPDTIRVEANQRLFIATDQRGGNTSSARQAVDEYRVYLDAGTFTGTPTGFSQIDEDLGDMQPGELIILAGNDGMGKTSLLCSIILNVLKSERRVAAFFCEATKNEIIRQFTAMVSGVYQSKLRSRQLTHHDRKLVNAALDRIAEYKLDIIDWYPSLSPMEMRIEMAKLTALNGNYDLIVGDGLWLMKHHTNIPERFTEVNEITRDCIQIARDYSAPMLLTHQYRDEMKLRKDKRPLTTDLAESAAVRRNAHVILGFHRQSYYDRNLVDDYSAELHYLKRRGGIKPGTPRKWAELMFKPTHSLYYEPESVEAESKDESWSSIL